jgi:hypothetical protein
MGFRIIPLLQSLSKESYEINIRKTGIRLLQRMPFAVEVRFCFPVGC